MSEPARDLDFARYAPALRPQVVWRQPSVPAPAPAEPDELVLVWRTISRAGSIVWQGLWIGAYILWLRASGWCEANILRSLTASWSLAGLGWGGFIGISLIQFLTR